MNLTKHKIECERTIGKGCKRETEKILKAKFGIKRILVRVKAEDNITVPEWEAMTWEPVGNRTEIGAIGL